MKVVGITACGALLLAAVVACGGGGGGGSSVPAAPTPTPTPGPPIVVTPSSACSGNASCLQFSSTGSSESFAASEATYAGPLTVTLGSDCAQVVSLSSPASVTPSVAGGTTTFTLTSVGTGKCTVTVNDARFSAESAALTVQVASVPIVLH